MADVINLNQKRKAKARADNGVKAVENRAKFGRTKAEKTLEALKEAKAERDLAGHQRETTEGEEE